MRMRKAIASVAVVALSMSMTGMAADNELEKLKASASQYSASLKIVEEDTARTVQEGRPYNVTLFKIDTGTAKCLLRYKSFIGAEAADNPKLLNDCSSGYGMLQPHDYWYSNGFLDASVKTSQGCLYASTCEGVVQILEKSGPRVAFDLVFDKPDARIVMRTIALVGRDELFIEVLGKVKTKQVVPFTLSSAFTGYPLGFKGPFDRCVHVEGSEIKNTGSENATTTLDLEKAPWLLLTDHQLNAEGKQSGQLGIVFDKAGVKGALVTHGGNYAIVLNFVGAENAAVQKFIVCDFSGMSAKQAEVKLTALAKESATLFMEAFGEEKTE